MNFPFSNSEALKELLLNALAERDARAKIPKMLPSRNAMRVILGPHAPWKKFGPDEPGKKT